MSAMSCPSIGRVSLRAPLAAPRRAAPAPAVRGAALRVRAAGNIVETAASGAAGNFTKLLAAATAAGLADTLSGPGPFTVFAPTDEAFAALPPGTLDGLLKDKEMLTQVLLFHVCKGKTASRHVVNAPSIPTLNPWGVKLTLDTKSGGKGVVRIGCKEVGKQGLNAEVIGGKIIKPDIECSNGVIHVVDAVLIPIKPLPGNNGFSPDSELAK